MPDSFYRPQQTLSPSSIQRRALIQKSAAILLLSAADIAWGATIFAVRVWPADEYTRVTIESDGLLVAKQFFVTSPPRLAVDIEGIELNPALRELIGRVKSDDPFIAGVRVGQNAPGVVRLVLDLKQPALPQVFNLPPVAAYQHRLVFDLYPTKELDPLEALIADRLSAKQGAAGATAATAAASAVKSPSPRDPLGELITQKGATSAPRVASSTTINATNTNATNTIAASAYPTGVSSQNSTKNLPPIASATVKTDRFIVVALDPGHGGEDPGAIGPAGTREKDIVLQVAHKLRDRINAASAGGNPMRAYLTRDADFFVPLHVRVQKAQRVQADLFISIHADAFTEARAKGASVFALSEKGASSASARYMAAKENSADLVGGVNVKVKDQQVQRAILDMSTTAQINDSLKLGTNLLGEIGGFAKLHKPRVEQAGFAVLKAPDIPSVLIETAFISNPEEEQKLRSEDYQNQLADALMRGIQRYFAKNPPLARTRTSS